LIGGPLLRAFTNRRERLTALGREKHLRCSLKRTAVLGGARAVTFNAVRACVSRPT
jgi:hypothetical protein